MFRKKTTQREKEFVDRQVKKLPRFVFIIFLVYFLLFTAYICWYIYFKSTYSISKVEGISMQNTLNPNAADIWGADDMVYVNQHKTPERFDIVIIQNEEIQSDGTKKSIPLIKRAIAFGGEYVTIRKSEVDNFYHVYLYDEAAGEATMIVEDYIKDYSEWTNGISANILENNYEGKFYNYFILNEGHSRVVNGEYRVIDHHTYVCKEFDGIKYLQVPEDEIFFLGDNRASSSDSRERGTAIFSRIEGVAEMILPDANKPGANVLGIKIKAIFSYYWKKLTQFFAR